MRLSVLDQSIAVAGRPQDLSIRNTVALAQHCEALGYERFWVSEHHNHPTIVGTAPEIVIAAIAATTKSIRIGSAGIMLPHYSAFKVAEVFRVLDALAPGLHVDAVDDGAAGVVGQGGLHGVGVSCVNFLSEYLELEIYRDGKVWSQNNGFAVMHRYDLTTGNIETFAPFKDSKVGENHNIYDVISDSKNNVFFTDFRQQEIGRIDAKTGKVTFYSFPTPVASPRRGSMDDQDRL